jgi:hypothetical protein
MKPWKQFLSGIAILYLSSAVFSEETEVERDHLLGDWRGAIGMN